MFGTVHHQAAAFGQLWSPGDARQPVLRGHLRDLRPSVEECGVRKKNNGPSSVSDDRGERAEADADPRNPIRQTFTVCCASTANGVARLAAIRHEAAPVDHSIT